MLETAIEYKLGWELALERRKRLGLQGPDPIPHPDDIEIDMRTGTVIIRGPMTKEEKARLESFPTQGQARADTSRGAAKDFSDDPDHEHRSHTADDIDQAERILDLVRRTLPD